MMQKTMWEEPEDSFLLQYEKRKIQECAGTLHNLASAFLIEDEEEVEKDRQNLFCCLHLSPQLLCNKINDRAVLISINRIDKVSDRQSGANADSRKKNNQICTVFHRKHLTYMQVR